MKRALLIIFLLGVNPTYAVEAPPIDAGTLQRTLPPAASELPSGLDQKEKSLIQDQAAEPAISEIRVEVKKIKVTGNSLVSTDDILAILNPNIGKSLGMADLEGMAKLVGELYRKKGYWARAYLPDQDVTSGEVWVDVIEAKLGTIRLETSEDNLRFSKDRALSIVSRGQKTGSPIKILDLEKSIRELDNVSGITAAVVLDRGKKEGETDVVVKMANTPYITGSLRADNHGSRSTGYNRGVLYLTLDSPFKFGEQFNLQYVKTAKMDFYSLGASYPLRNDGTEVSVMYTNMDYRLGFPLQDLKAAGNSDSYAMTLSRPFFGGYDSDFKASFSYAHKTYYNEAMGMVTSDKRINGYTFSGMLNSTDEFMGGGMTFGSLSYVAGDLDLGGASTDLETDQQTARRQGHFSKVAVSLTRVQQITPKNVLWLTLNGQHAYDNLDSSEKISLGGPTAVRAYPTAEANGDDGVVVSAELRHQLRDKFQLTAFYDWGHIHLNHRPWKDWNSGDPSISNGYELKGWGLGCRWNFLEGYELVGNLAKRINDNPGRSSETGKDADGTFREYRGWLSITKVF